MTNQADTELKKCLRQLLDKLDSECYMLSFSPVEEEEPIGFVLKEYPKIIVTIRYQPFKELSK